MLGDGDKEIEVVCGEVKKIFCTGSTRAAKTEQKSLVPARQAQRTNQGMPPFICTLWVPFAFTSVATVSRGHPLSSHSETHDRKGVCKDLFSIGGHVRPQKKVTRIARVDIKISYTKVGINGCCSKEETRPISQGYIGNKISEAEVGTKTYIRRQG